MSDPVVLQYRAFISYSHADEHSAKWLHRWLERFRGDEDLIGRDAAGTIHKTLRPIFHHGDDISAGDTLALAALDASHALIVICSPASAKSPYVNEKIRLFKSRHPERPVIPVIVGGKAGDPQFECFPPSLKFKLDADGKITDEPIGVAAADAREEGDGKDLALAKIVARLLGVSSDEVFRRSERGFRNAKRENRRRARIAAIKVGIKGGIAAAFLALIALASAFGYFDYQKRQTLADIEALVTKYGAADSARASVSGAEQSLIEALTSIAQGAARDPRDATALELVEAAKYEEAEPLLEAVAEDKKKLAASNNKEAAEAFRNLASIAAISDPGKARGYYAEAAALDPDHVEGMFWNGWFQAEAGSLNEAETAYRRVIRTAKAGKDDWALYWARLGVGDIRIRRGDLSAAIAQYHAASEMADRLIQADPDNAGWHSDFPVAYIRVGDVLAAQGSLAEALKAYRKGLAITDRLAKADLDNAGWQRDLVASYGRAGLVLAQQGEATLARDAFYRGRAIAAQLKKQFADDALLPKQLAAFDAEIAKLEQLQPAQAAR
jgi:tetratricopeptide (TPR) repeat protein